jgi:hypothetical protein
VSKSVEDVEVVDWGGVAVSVLVIAGRVSKALEDGISQPTSKPPAKVPASRRTERTMIRMFLVV